MWCCLVHPEKKTCTGVCMYKWVYVCAHGGNDTLVWKHFAFGIAIFFFFWLSSFCWLMVLCCLLGHHVYTRALLVLSSIFLWHCSFCGSTGVVRSALSKPCRGVGEVRERGRSGFRSPASSQSGSGLRTGGSLCLTAVTQHPALLELLVLHTHRCLQGHKLGC